MKKNFILLILISLAFQLYAIRYTLYPVYAQEEQAIYTRNQVVMPKEAIKKEGDDFLKKLLGIFLRGIFFITPGNTRKMVAQSESTQQSIVPEELKPQSEDKNPLTWAKNQLTGFLGGSSGFYGVDMPGDVQSSDIKQSEKMFEQANFPEGINPVTGNNAQAVPK